MRVVNCCKESGQFGFIEKVVGTNTTADVEAERGDAGYGLRGIAGVEAACEEDGNRDGFADTAAGGPVVNAPCSAQLFHGKRGIAGIEQ